MLHHRSPVITTLRLVGNASNPKGGHYIGMFTKRPLILKQRLLLDIKDITRESKEHNGAEEEVAHVLDLLEGALDVLFPLWSRTADAPAVFGQVSRAAEDAVKRILERDRARVQKEWLPGGP